MKAVSTLKHVLHSCCANLRACLVAGVLLGFFSQAALARTVLDLDASKQPIALSDWGEYWIDSDSKRAPNQVDASTAITWLPTPERGIYPLKPGQALWIRFTIPPAPDDERWMLEIPYPALDRASLYTKDREGNFTEERAGDLTAVNHWLTPHRYPLLIVAFNAEEPTHYLLRLENAQGFSAPLNFVSARYVLRSEQRASLFLGLYFGVAVLGLLIGLIGFVWQRDIAYFYYGLCAAAVGLSQAVASGLAGMLLWPDSPYWADRSLVVVGCIGLLVFLRLNATVIYLWQRSRVLNLLVWATVLAGLTLAGALLVTDSALRLKLLVPYMALILVMTLAINTWVWRYGDRLGGWLLLSTLPFIAGMGLSIARYLQLLPLSFATENGVMASLALELLFLAILLIARSQRQRENSRRISGLDRIDPATGLINEHVFAARLLRMAARSEKFNHKSVVLLIDIINTEQIQRDFGRKIADELPLRVASRLLTTAREVDTAARLGDKRFGLLVEGPVSSEAASTLGPRIITRCLMPYAGMHDDCVAQVRIAYALVPHKTNGGKSLMTRLEERLNLASINEDKRAVFFVADLKEGIGQKNSVYGPI